jgi:hypothetical protein
MLIGYKLQDLHQASGVVPTKTVEAANGTNENKQL